VIERRAAIIAGGRAIAPDTNMKPIKISTAGTAREVITAFATESPNAIRNGASDD
jgi:hypothetical protein